MAGEKRHRVQILYRTVPAWEVGAGTPEVIKGSHYPDDYAGKVIAVKPPDHPFTPADLSGGRGLVELDLTDGEAAVLANRLCKVAMIDTRFGLLPVEFEDRWGQLAVGLRERWGSRAEAKEAESIIESPIQPVDSDFSNEVARLKAVLPAMIVHSGVGLYEVGPGKTYSTIQSALDALWTHQGAAVFTASQYIRVFADTYAEYVIPNAGLAPVITAGFLLIVEGDPADDRDNIIWDGSGNPYCLYANCDQILLRHLKFIGSGTTNMIRAFTGCAKIEIDDCISDGARSIFISNYGYVHDSEITVTDLTAAFGIAFSVNNTLGGLVERCTITGSGSGSSTDPGVWVVGAGAPVTVRGCVIDGFESGILDNSYGDTDMINNTIYDCVYGVRMEYPSGARRRVFNNIFKDCTYNYLIEIAEWPEESSTRMGGRFIQRNNCYHGYTSFAYDGVDTKTYAEWIAYGLVDDDGELDATDPLLTTPGSDFSLQVGSPCRHAGHGSGVTRDYLGAAFDPHTPDIGAWSSGVIDVVSAPTWTSNVSNISAVDAVRDGEVDLNWDAATPSNAAPVGYILEYRETVGPGSWTESGRTIITTFTVPNLTNGTGYDFRVKAYSRVTGEPTQTAADTDSATPTAPVLPTPSVGVVGGLGILRRTPHSVTLKRPNVTRDTDNNVATRDYDNPILTKTVRCLFQTRGGEVSIGDEGNIVPFDAVFYTLDKDIQPNDRIEVDLSFHTGNFLVTAVVPKARQIGIYSHNEIILQKDGVR